MAPVTIHDVAREAGVSHTTVSRALNNKGELSGETRARILEVAERLHYVPSSVAQALASGATRTLGLIITNSASPVYAAIVHAIEGAAHAVGYGLLLCNSAEDQEQALRCLAMLQAKKVDGLILASDGAKSLYLIEPDPSGYKQLASAELFPEAAASSSENDIAFRVGGRDQNWAPMARSVMGGLTVATVLTLVVVPIIYYYMERVGERIRGKRSARVQRRLERGKLIEDD